MRAAALLALLVLLAGCATTSGPGSEPGASPAESTIATTETDGPPPTPVPDLLGEGVPCDDGLFVSLWGVNEGFWEPDEVRTAYTLPQNTSILWVTYVDGSVRGVKHHTEAEGGFTVDGASHQLNESFTGDHVVRVVGYDDANDNGRFDRGTDRPCLDGGEVVRAGPDVVDFDAASGGQ